MAPIDHLEGSWFPVRIGVASIPVLDAECSAGRCRLIGCAALRLPVELIVRDQVVFVHGCGRVVTFRLLECHKKYIQFFIFQMQHTFAMAWPTREAPVSQGNHGFVSRISCMNRQWRCSRFICFADKWRMFEAIVEQGLKIRDHTWVKSQSRLRFFI